MIPISTFCTDLSLKISSCTKPSFCPTNSLICWGHHYQTSLKHKKQDNTPHQFLNKIDIRNMLTHTVHEFMSCIAHVYQAVLLYWFKKKCNSVFKFLLLYCYHLPPLSEYFLWKCSALQFFLKTTLQKWSQIFRAPHISKNTSFLSKVSSIQTTSAHVCFCDMKLILFHLKSNLIPLKTFRFRLSQGKKIQKWL